MGFWYNFIQSYITKNSTSNLYLFKANCTIFQLKFGWILSGKNIFEIHKMFDKKLITKKRKEIIQIARILDY